jgi:hypothetical protein
MVRWRQCDGRTAVDNIVFMLIPRRRVQWQKGALPFVPQQIG